VLHTETSTITGWRRVFLGGEKKGKERNSVFFCIIVRKENFEFFTPLILGKSSILIRLAVKIRVCLCQSAGKSSPIFQRQRKPVRKKVMKHENCLRKKENV
jgi:hypothetical protein